MTTPDSQVPGLSANVAFVPSELGRKIGELVVTACADLKANPCNIGYIWSVKAAALDQALKVAFDKAIASHPEIKVVSDTGESFYTTALGLKASQDIVAAHPDVSVIVSADQAITGAVVAVKDIKDKVRLVGYGGGTIALQGIASGERFGTVMQMPATEGGQGTTQLIQAIRSGTPTEGVDPLAIAAGRRRRDQGQRRDLPAARGVAGLNPTRSADAMATAASDATHLDVRGLGKSFGATRALDEVSVAIRAGTVHAFVGENGAGKSTLGKIIAGVFPQDQGDLVLRGTTVSFRSPREALTRGIALVAQEVALVPRLTAAENVFLGAEPRRAGFIERGTLRDRFDRLVADAGFDIKARRSWPAAARPAAAGGDPPRAGPRRGPHRPRRALRQPVGDRDGAAPRGRPALRTRGHTVILVSHFLGEVLDLSDTVTVLRDGRVVRTGPTATRPRRASSPGCSAGRPAGRTRRNSRRPPMRRSRSRSPT